MDLNLNAQQQAWLIEQGWSDSCTLDPELVQQSYLKQNVRLSAEVLAFLAHFASFTLYIPSPLSSASLEQVQFDVVQLSRLPQTVKSKEDTWDGQDWTFTVVARFLNSPAHVLAWTTDEGLCFGLQEVEGEIHLLGHLTELLDFLKGERSLHLDAAEPLFPRQVAALEMDGAQLNTLADFHRLLQKELHFPAHYGFNLHALWDVLSTDVPRPLHLSWKHSALSRARFGQGTFEALLDVLQRVARLDESRPEDQRFTFELR